jgi:cysteine desulfurase
LASLRNRLWKLLHDRVDGIELCGPGLNELAASGGPLRLPGNLDVAFGNVDGEALLLAMGNLAVSSGAACSSTDPSPSHVLLALGLSEDLARSTLRFGLGRFNTAAEVDEAAKTVTAAVARLRELR